jgi:hypothetical protein
MEAILLLHNTFTEGSRRRNTVVGSVTSDFTISMTVLLLQCWVMRRRGYRITAL